MTGEFMAIQFVIGSTGTGKTVHIMDEMFLKQKEGHNETQLYIVPEQYTLKAQEEFLIHTKANGLLHIEVLSFNRLVNRFMDDLGIAHKKVMSDLSMSMIVRKLLQQHADTFIWLSKNAKQQSFVEEISTIIKECYQYTITPEKLFQIGEAVDEQLLKDKLADIGKLLELFKNEQKESFITQDEAMLLLCERLIFNPMLKNAYIYIDGFYGFTPLQYKIIESLIKTAPKVTFCITIPADEALSDLRDETDIFYESKKIISHVRLLADENTIPEMSIIKLADQQRKQPKSLKHLAKSLFRHPIQVFDEPDKHIRFIESGSIQDEVECVALRIHQLIYERKYRYKDIVVLASELQAYEEDIKIIFDEYRFNYFLDKKEGITNHPIVQFILSALLINQYNFRYEHIFYHLKSIFYERQNEVEVLENICLRRGIKGYKRWNENWSEFQEEKNQFMEPILKFHQYMNEAKTISTKVKGLYYFLESVKIIERCSDIAESLNKEEQIQEAQTYDQVYELIVDMLEQIVDLIGEETISKKDFVSLIETGLSQIKLGQTPVNVDQLLVGQMNRSRFKEVKAIFVLGMNEGKVPLIMDSSSLLTDHERNILSSKGTEFAPTTELSLFKEQIAIYIGLTRSTQLLHLSFANQGNDEVQRPAPLMLTLFKLFPRNTIEKAKDVIECNDTLTRILPLYKKMVRLATDDGYMQHEDTINLLYNLLKMVYNYVGKEIILEPSLFKKGLDYQNKSVVLEDLVDDIYQFGVSELETYSTCPYQHFLTYRLKINERQEFVVTLPDIGNLFHECLELYLKKCLNRQLDLCNMGTTLRNALIEESINELLSHDKYIIFKSSYQNQYLIIKLTRILKRAIWGIEQHVSRHILRPKELEYKFSGKTLQIEPLRLYANQGTQLYLKGVVDRIDEYDAYSTNFYRIIDYKSSHNELDFNLVNKGVQLQLYLYLDVVKSIKEHDSLKKVVPVGLYYYQIQDPYIKIEDDQDTGETPYENKENDPFELERIKVLSPKGFALNNELLEELLVDDNHQLNDEEKDCVKKALHSSKSASLTSDELETTLDYVHQMATDISEKIYHGHIPIEPYRYGQTTSCDYCEYKGICRFDPTNTAEKFELVIKKSKDDVVSQMKGVCNGRSHKEDYSD